MNRSPLTTINLKTPQKLWFKKPSDYSGLRIFGFPAYAHMNDGRLEPREMQCIFLGYATRVKCYRLWCIEKGRTPKIMLSRDVTFDEFSICNQGKSDEIQARNKDQDANQKVDFAT